jgi:hypothetical protein
MPGRDRPRRACPRRRAGTMGRRPHLGMRVERFNDLRLPPTPRSLVGCEPDAGEGGKRSSAAGGPIETRFPLATDLRRPPARAGRAAPRSRRYGRAAPRRNACNPRRGRREQAAVAAALRTGRRRGPRHHRRGLRPDSRALHGGASRGPCVRRSSSRSARGAAQFSLLQACFKPVPDELRRPWGQRCISGAAPCQSAGTRPTREGAEMRLRPYGVPPPGARLSS